MGAGVTPRRERRGGRGRGAAELLFARFAFCARGVRVRVHGWCAFHLLYSMKAMKQSMIGLACTNSMNAAYASSSCIAGARERREERGERREERSRSRLTRGMFYGGPFLERDARPSGAGAHTEDPSVRAVVRRAGWSCLLLWAATRPHRRLRTNVKTTQRQANKNHHHHQRRK